MNMIILHHEPKISNHRLKKQLLVADVLRQFSLPFLHAFWPLKSHKFGDDIQGTVSNTNMPNLLKMNKEDTCLRRHCCLYKYQDNDISTHYTTNINGNSPDVETQTDRCVSPPMHPRILSWSRSMQMKPSQYTFLGGSYFKIDQIMSGVLLTTRILDNKSKKKYSWHHDFATQKTSNCLTNILQNHAPPNMESFANIFSSLRIVGPSKLAMLRTLTLRHTGSGPLPLEGPRSLGMVN